MSKLSLELQTDLKNKAINLCCDITKLFDERWSHLFEQLKAYL